MLFNEIFTLKTKWPNKSFKWDMSSFILLSVFLVYFSVRYLAEKKSKQ